MWAPADRSRAGDAASIVLVSASRRLGTAMRWTDRSLRPTQRRGPM